MRRRRLLALLGTAATASAGCLGGGGGTPEPLDVEALFADRCRAISDAGGDPASPPGPPSGCPSYTDAWESFCGADAPVVLEGGGDPIELPRGSTTLTLRNRGDRPFASDFECGQLYQYHPDGWRFAERACNAAGFTLEPGAERTFELRVDNRALCGTTELTRWPDPTTLLVRAIGPGHWRLLLNGRLGDGSDAESVSVSGPFRVSGPELPLVPGPDVTGAERDGTEVSVRTRQFAEAGEGERYVVTWSRINPDARFADEVYVEDAYGIPAARQSFPFFDVLEDVNTVQHYTDWDNARKGFVATVAEGALERARYNGQVYKMTRRKTR